MTTCPSLTPAQRAAAKPWGIASLSLWVAEMLSFLALAILFIDGVSIEPRVMFLWVGATIIAKRLLQMYFTHRLKRIVGPDFGPSVRRQWSGVAIQFVLFSVLVALTFL
jgi:hypothetical protein